MSDWGSESEDLFRSARRGLSPSAGDRERVRSRIRAKLAAAAVGTAMTGAAAKAAGASSGAGAAGVGASAAAGAGVSGAAGAGVGVAAKGLSFALIAKIAVPVMIAGAGLAAAPHVLSSRAPAAPAAPAASSTIAPVVRAAPPAPATLPAAMIVAAPEPIAVEALPAVTTATAAPPAIPPRAAHPVSAPATAAAPSPSPSPPPSLPPSANEGEEAALVGAIDAALRSGDAAGALRLAADHQRRFPQGILTEEREGARVVARCISARSPTASDAASAFLAAHPRSPMRARIAAACGTTEAK